MSHPKTQRNKAIIKKRQLGWSFRRIAYFFNLDVATVYAIWKRWDLSTGQSKTSDK